jgi:hypothetical protein
VTSPGIRGESIIPDRGWPKEAREAAAENLIRVWSPRKREGDRSAEKYSVVYAGGKPGSLSSRKEAGKST